MAEKETKLQNLDQFKSWAKETGFIFPSSEIYGGFQAVYDYGHYGSILKDNIANAWKRSMVQERTDMVGLDSAIFMHPKTWEASGHVSGFADVLVEDKKTNKRHRADHLIEEWFMENKGESVDMDKKTSEELAQIIKENDIRSPDGNELATPRNFNLLVRSNLGTTDSSFNEENVTYLRGETCQGIYLNYKNVVDNMRVKVPFGIAQVGKAFRNEIVARQFNFRKREFEQMEMQYFIHPDDNDKMYEFWKKERMDWCRETLGLPEQSLRFHDHAKLIFYAKAAVDIEYKFNSMGGEFKEIEGVHARSDYDLTQHAKFSGQKLDYFDQEKGERYVPWIVETASGLDRMVMAVLDAAWSQEAIDGDEDNKRVVLRIKKELAPIKVAVLPLSKKPELQEKAMEVFNMLKDDYYSEYDETASIGKRYRRQDEIGTPFCVTIDFDSLDDDSVTVRDRDTMEQERVKISELERYLGERLG